MAESHENDSLLREIDEEIRQENLNKLWERFGTHIIGAAVALVVVVAGYQGWTHWEKSARLEQGAKFAGAQDLQRTKSMDEARGAFAAFAADARPGYALLARFREADILASQGKAQEAADAYRLIAGDTGTDTLYRDLATLYGVLHEMTGKADANELSSRLAPLMADNNPWRYTARELTAVLALDSGSTEQAKQMFTELSQDPAAPSGIVERAKEMLAAMGGTG